MDPITAAALAAMAGSAGSEAGRQAWSGLTDLVRRPFRRGTIPEPTGAGSPRVSSGELELTALRDDSTDPNRAQALATALHVRAALDEEFRVRLDEWWREAQAAGGGGVHNSVSGGVQNGPVVQGRDFSNLTFNMTRGTGDSDPE
ncbi:MULTISPECIES: hypothetical protein [unclassified Streptomyces]|uniref:hypothetical protein n=1 Tax=unclassified Streptomyces TaxID=2593676 RepID=UPI000364B580|nr:MULTISPECIES: hypothetical protein [unclassified Streptomyces]MYY03349.1 hypothetical protein [Streptomyces sp. SID4913]